MERLFLSLIKAQVSESQKKTLKRFYVRAIIAGLAQGAFLSFYPLFAAKAGLSLSQISFAASISFLLTFTFELPTGVLADRVSRKLSVSIAVSFFLATTSLFSILPFNHNLKFELFLIGSCFFGMGVAMRSGALSAWFVDELKGEKRVPLGNVFALNRIILNISMIIGSFSIFSLYQIEKNLNFTLGVLSMGFCTVLYFLQLVYLQTIPESPTWKKDSSKTNGGLQESARFIFQNKALTCLFLFSAAIFAFLETLNLYYPIFFGLEKSKSVLIDSFQVPLVLALTITGRTIGNGIALRSDGAKTKILLLLGSIVCFFSVASIGLLKTRAEVLVWILILLFSSARTGEGILRPTIEGEINEAIPSRIRSTALSIDSLIGNLLVAGLLLVPSMSGVTHIPLLWSLSAGLLVVFCALYLSISKKLTQHCIVDK